ncbi:HTH-type transcriptional regulator RutR [Pseudomonas massiliensis]|uniref:HTH-type transcriptional regulator RutR n=1 Tax=Pseudomonas massiliensis TaxID=522492 RepID=UPI0038CD5837
MNDKTSEASSSPGRRPGRTISEKARNRRSLMVENKRASIIQAALGLFSQYGLHGTSLDQVASSADVSKTNLLYYFGSKEDLYVSVLEQVLDTWLAPLRGFSADQDPLQAIGQYLRAKLELSRDHSAESKLFCMEIMQGAPLIGGQLSQALRELVASKVEVIGQWVEAGRLAPVDPYHLIFSLWSTTQHYADFGAQVRAIAGKDLSDPAFFEATLASLQALLLDGLKPRP